MIKDLTDNFAFPDGDEDDAVTPQMLHDLCIALGATCKHCKTRKSVRRKALDRVATSTAVMARARQRRFALAQHINAVMAETDSPQHR